MQRLARTLHVRLMPQRASGARVGFAYLPERSHGDVLHEAVMRGLEWMFGEG